MIKFFRRIRKTLIMENKTSPNDSGGQVPQIRHWRNYSFSDWGSNKGEIQNDNPPLLGGD